MITFIFTIVVLLLLFSVRTEGGETVPRDSRRYGYDPYRDPYRRDEQGIIGSIFIAIIISIVLIVLLMILL